MTMQLKEIESLIKETFPDAIVEIQDLAGDGNHYSATVISSKFAGKTKIQQHKMVYDSLKGKMGNELHALALKTKEKEQKRKGKEKKQSTPKKGKIKKQNNRTVQKPAQRKSKQK